MDMILLDFKKLSIASHTMSYWSSFGTLASQVICGTGLELTLLIGNSMTVYINNCHSSVLPVISGVPQDYILGPLLFLVFINDLPDCVLNSTISLSADDAKCSLPISKQSDCLQNDLDVLAVWSKHWNLFLNESKCSLVRFGLQMSSSPHVYSINSCEIQSVSQHKDLGIIVSGDLSWTNHILYSATQQESRF